MADEMRLRLDELLEPDRLVLEVDALDVRSGRKAAPVRDHELEAVGERLLRAPGEFAVDDAAMHEEQARPAHVRDRTNSTGNTASTGNTLLQSPRPCPPPP